MRRRDFTTNRTTVRRQGVTTTPEAEVVRPPTPDFVVLVAGDTISGGGRKTVKLGSTVRIQVVADTADEVHLHGYDKKVDLVKGNSGQSDLQSRCAGHLRS